ncbi:MAG: glycogen/starch synthase [Bacteroidales bacterium]
MASKRVLFISQEIFPYVEENEVSKISRFLPQQIQEAGKEIRAFMPRYGVVNERRFQLHEVIRLSGMNMVIDDADRQLIIKVASIQPARMQVYFIDGEDYFHRKAVLQDEDGTYFPDNDERSVFFSRGVLETVIKLRWAPDIIHCHGWFSALIPFYLKSAYSDNPLLNEAKIVYSAYNNDFEGHYSESFHEKMLLDGIDLESIKHLSSASCFDVNKLAIDNSDAVIYGSEQINSDLTKYIKDSNVLSLAYQGDDYVSAYNNLYDKLLES